MLNSANFQRALRPEGPIVTTPALRRTGKVQTHNSISGHRQKAGARNGVVSNAQSFGRGQPPNQPQPMSLVRRPFYDPMEPIQPSFVKMSELMDKDVISSTTGRKLGKLGEAWVDAARLEVTCFDLEFNGAIGVVPLLTIKQAGDVVLVQEDGVLKQPLDSRFGFTKLLGWEVRTPSNRALGKVRDMTFSRDTGTITKIEFDDFGLRFLRADFFDRFSVSADAIRQCAYGIVSLAADNVQCQEKQGILSSLLRRVGGAQQLAGLLADGSRGSEAASLLPQGYSYEQWQNDVRVWEAQTGCSYEEYMIQTGQTQGFGVRRGGNALPPGRPPQQVLLPEARQPGMPNYALPPPSTSSQPQQSRPGMPQQQQQQPGYGAGLQQNGMYAGGSYGNGYSGGADPRFRGASAAQTPPRGAAPQPRYPANAAPQQPQAPLPQQQQWPQPAAQPQAVPQGQRQQWTQTQQPSMQPPGGPAPPPAPQQQQQQQALQRPMPGAPARGPMAGLGVGIPGAPGASGGQVQQSQIPMQPPVQTMPQPPMGQQQQPQPQPQAQQYGWSGPPPGPSAGLGAAQVQQQQQQLVGQNGVAAGGGPMRVEEWMARGLQGQVNGYEQGLEGGAARPPTPAGAQAAQQTVAADAPGWDLPGGSAGQRPQPF